VFLSSEQGAAELLPEWRYENTSGTPTVAVSYSATIDVQQLRFRNVSIGHQYHPDYDDDEPYFGYVWVLSDDLVEVIYPERTLPKPRQAKSVICQNGKSFRYGDIGVPVDGTRRWTPTGVTGKQNAWAVIEADIVNPQSASL